jgi:probable F420-dependent oxidoreductase
MRPLRFFGVAADGADGAPDARRLAAVARTAEAAGFAGLVLPDHLLEQHAPIPVLATIAAVTERLRIAPFVLNAGLRHPAVLAQDLATLDVLSDGRLDVAIGAGWNKAEHDAIGLPFLPARDRVAFLADAVAVLRGCFGPGPFSHSGPYFRIEGHDGYPKPVQRPHPPLFIGAGGRRMLSFAGREADIVGLAPRVVTLPGGRVAAEAASMTLAGAEEKVGWVRAAAGDRFSSIELNVYPSGGPLVITDNAIPVARERADTIQRLTGVELTVDEVLESPHVFVGSLDYLAEKILGLRERLGVTSFMLGDVETAIPVVERLAGA